LFIELLLTHKPQEVPLPFEHTEQRVQVLGGQPMNASHNYDSVTCVLQGRRPATDM